MRYVLLNKYAADSGYTEKALSRKIEEGVWIEGQQYLRAPDNRIHVDLRYQGGSDVDCAGSDEAPICGVYLLFEGDVPVYATMVSTGAKDTPTETGIYRMWVKESEADMKGLNGEDPYSVATVPWTQFFSPEKGLALHTAYWHDRFGIQKSHGCVNLAPRDARWLYFFTDPQVPPGWSMAAGVVEQPGSIVRVRSKDDPDPPVKGYAQKVDATADASDDDSAAP